MEVSLLKLVGERTDDNVYTYIANHVQSIKAKASVRICFLLKLANSRWGADCQNIEDHSTGSWIFNSEIA